MIVIHPLVAVMPVSEVNDVVGKETVVLTPVEILCVAPVRNILQMYFLNVRIESDPVDELAIEPEIVRVVQEVASRFEVPAFRDPADRVVAIIALLPTNDSVVVISSSV